MSIEVKPLPRSDASLRSVFVAWKVAAPRMEPPLPAAQCFSSQAKGRISDELRSALETARNLGAWHFRPTSSGTGETPGRAQAAPIEVMAGTVIEHCEEHTLVWLEDENGDGREVSLPRALIDLSLEPGDQVQVLFFSDGRQISAKFKKLSPPSPSELQRSLDDLQAQLGGE